MKIKVEVKKVVNFRNDKGDGEILKEEKRGERKMRGKREERKEGKERKEKGEKGW